VAVIERTLQISWLLGGFISDGWVSVTAQLPQNLLRPDFRPHLFSRAAFAVWRPSDVLSRRADFGCVGIRQRSHLGRGRSVPQLVRQGRLLSEPHRAVLTADVARWGVTQGLQLYTSTLWLFCGVLFSAYLKQLA